MSIVKHPKCATTGRRCHPHGVVVHDTVGPEGQTAQQCADQLVNGVTQWNGKLLPPPIYHFVIGPDSTGFRLAENHVRANHCGKCDRNALDRLKRGAQPLPPSRLSGPNGNKWTLGVAFVRRGTRAIPLPQMQRMVQLLASLCRDHGWSTDRVVGHWELTKRKIDPSLGGSPMDMNVVRGLVQHELAGERWRWNGRVSDPPSSGSVSGAVVLRFGYEGNHLLPVQQRLVEVGLLRRLSGVFDEDTVRAVKVYQRCYRLAADGVVGAKTWKVLTG